jgi:hypothetical protein
MAQTPARLAERQAREAPTWRARLEALRYIPQFIRLMWQTHRGYTTAMVGLRLCRAFTPLATLWVGKLIIDAVVALREGPADVSRLWPLVALELAIVLAGEVLARASVLVESLLGERFSAYTSMRVMAHAATLDLSHFEDPTFYDRLERARRQTGNRVGLLAQFLTVGQDMLTLMTLSAGLFVYSPWLLLILAVAVLPSFLGEMHFAALEYALASRWTPERRQLDYLRYVSASDETIKEVQLFALAPWLVERFRRLSDHLYAEHKQLAIRKGGLSAAMSILARPPPAPAARRQRGLPAVPVSPRPLSILRDEADDQLAPRRALSSPADPSRRRVRRRRVPLPRPRHLGLATRELPPASRRACRLRGGEWRREDDAHQAAGAAIRPHRGAHSA